MGKQYDSNAVSALRKAILKAFPNHTDLADIHLDEDYARTWQNFARALGINSADLAQALAPYFGMEVAPSLEKVTSEALEVLPLAFCQANNLLPLSLDGDVLSIVTADPQDFAVRERARFLAGRPIKWLLSSPQAIEDAQIVVFSREAERLSAPALAKYRDDLGYDENAIVKLSRALMATAIEHRASDLHIQPFLGAYVARIRVDGLLRRLNMLPDAVAITLIRHIKAVCGMDSTNNLVPQDGRMSMVIDGRDFDMRVSTLPANRGERLVIRFLDQGRVHRLSGAGFSLAALQTLRRVISRPSGLVIMTGPTGCGKTSTLYAMLAELNRSSVNILTVEDPVEYRIPGISQVEVNDKAGRGFAATLRSMLRQDPDVVLVGEIRDRETAEIAAQAALTGHLVLTTLHTNDAITAIPRLLNLGVQPSILADSLIAVVAQRLCRTLCPACKQPVVEPLAPDEQLFFDLTRNRPSYRPKGCPACEDTGYRGRLPIVDIIEMNKELRDAIAVGESRIAALDELRTTGLKSLAASGSLRVISGDTTVSEVMDAVGPSFWHEVSRHYGAYFSMESAASIPINAAEGQGVLLMSKDGDLAASLTPILESKGFRLVVAETAELAHERLENDEEIAFIIGDVPESFSTDEAAKMLQHNRFHISWARLPAIVLLPESLMDSQEELRRTGVMGAFMGKPIDSSAVMSHIRRSQAR